MPTQRKPRGFAARWSLRFLILTQALAAAFLGYLANSTDVVLQVIATVLAISAVLTVLVLISHRNSSSLPSAAR
jgi:uncharacterized membrane protein HdeD (DUF308 family)